MITLTTQVGNFIFFLYTMSSNSRTESCPVCWEDTLDCLQESRPLMIETRCLHCGFSTSTIVWRSTLEDINANLDEDWFSEKVSQEEYDEYNNHYLFSHLKDEGN